MHMTIQISCFVCTSINFLKFKRLFQKSPSVRLNEFGHLSGAFNRRLEWLSCALNSYSDFISMTHYISLFLHRSQLYDIWHGTGTYLHCDALNVVYENEQLISNSKDCYNNKVIRRCVRFRLKFIGLYLNFGSEALAIFTSILAPSLRSSIYFIFKCQQNGISKHKRYVKKAFSHNNNSISFKRKKRSNKTHITTSHCKRKFEK